MEVNYSFSESEFSILRSALNESLELLDDPEFSIRLGCDRGARRHF